MDYDSWKLETPEDEAYRRHGRGPRRGKYSVTVERTIVATITVEVEASCEEDAHFDGVIAAKAIPLEARNLSGRMWTIDQDDYDTTDVEGPPERDPDDARDAEIDR